MRLPVFPQLAYGLLVHGYKAVPATLGDAHMYKMTGAVYIGGYEPAGFAEPETAVTKQK
jgi:hypothetical protein